MHSKGTLIVTRSTSGQLNFLSNKNKLQTILVGATSTEEMINILNQAHSQMSKSENDSSHSEVVDFFDNEDPDADFFGF